MVALVGSLLVVAPVVSDVAPLLGSSEARAQTTEPTPVLHRSTIVEGQTRDFEISNIPTRPEYYLQAAAGGRFTAESSDVTITTNDLFGRAQFIPPGSLARAYPDAVYGRIRFEVTANSDSDGTGDETFGVRLCTTAYCTGGTILGSWTITITEPAADATLNGTGATVTIPGGGALSVMETSANDDRRDRQATFTLNVTSAPSTDIVVVARADVGVRSGTNLDGTPFRSPVARVSGALSRDNVRPDDDAYDPVTAEYIVARFAGGATGSKTVTVVSNDNVVDTAGGALTGNLVFRVLNDDAAFRDATAGNATVYSGITIPNVPVGVIDDEPTRVRVLAASPADDTATEGSSSDTAKFRVRIDRALAAGERVAVPLRFTGATLGTHFTIAVDGSPTGVSLDADTAVVTFDGAGAQEATVVVTAATDDGNSVSETLRVNIPERSDPWRERHFDTNLAGGACAGAACADYDRTEGAQRGHRMTLVEATAGLSVIDGGDGRVGEGDTYDYSVRLNTAPSANVTVAVTSGDIAKATVTAGASLTFTPSGSGAWSVPQTVTVMANSDNTDTADAAVTITHDITGTGSYANIADVTHSLTVADDDATTVTMTGTGVRMSSSDSNISEVMLEGDASRVDRSLTVSLGRALAAGEYARVPLILQATGHSTDEGECDLYVADDEQGEGRTAGPPDDAFEHCDSVQGFRGPRISANVAWPLHHNDFVMTAEGTGVSLSAVNRHTPNYRGYRVLEFRGAGAQTATFALHARGGFDDGEGYDEQISIGLLKPLEIAALFGTRFDAGIDTEAAAGVAWFGIDDAEPAPEDTDVPSDWALLPPGLTVGDTFRLLYVTRGERNASEAGFGPYNTFVRDEITGDQLKAGGVDDLKPYANFFKAVISANSETDAPGGNASLNANLETAGPDVPIFWVDGTKVADNKADFLDGDWDDEANPKHADGTAATISTNGYWTGSEADGQRSDNCDGLTGSDRHLRAGAPSVSYGLLDDNARGPLGQAVDETTCQHASNTELRPLYALSTEAFTVVGGVTIELAHPASEGGPLAFNVTLPAGYTNSAGVTVPYTFADGRGVTGDPTYVIATGAPGGTGADYDNTAGSVNIPAGRRTAAFVVTTIIDSTYESDHYFTVTLGTPTSTGTPPSLDATNSSAIGIITDDDDLPTIQFSPTTATVAEDAGTVTVTVTKTGTTLVPSSVRWTTADGTGASAAAHPDDYTAAVGAVTIAPNETSKTITVNLVDDDTSESTETFKVQLSQPVDAQLGANTEATITINDDDSAPAVDVTMSASDGDADGDAVEGASGATGYRTVTLTLSRALTGNETVTVPLTVQGATVATDYTFGLQGTNTGVTLLTGGAHSPQNPAVRLTSGAVTATLRLTPINNGDRTQPYVVIAYGTAGRAPSATNATLGTPSGGPVGIVLVDDETGDIVVPSSWGLMPSSGVVPGDDFRLLFRTSTGRDATSGDIADYDAFIREVLATGGHSDILPYAGFFKVFASTRSSGGSTGATARVHNGMTSEHTGHTPTWVDGSGTDSDAAGTPIYWLNGAILANNYRDLCDLAWSGSGTGVRDGFDRNDPRSEDGAQNVPSGTITAQNHEPWTGSGNACEAYDYPLGNSQVSRGGYGGGGNLWHTAQAPNTQERPLYGLSPVFTREGAVASLSVSDSGAVTEGGTLTVTVTLNRNADANLSVPVRMRTSGAPTASAADFTLSDGGSVAIMSGSNSGTLTFTATDDRIDEDAETLVLELGALPSNFVPGALSWVRVTINDNDDARVSIRQAGGTPSIAENGGTATYNVSLDTQPLSEVVITARSDAPAAVVLSAGSQSNQATVTLTFTPQNWSVQQTVTMRGVNDDIDNVDDHRDARIRHSVTQGDTNGKYTTSMSVGNISLRVNDDDDAPTAISLRSTGANTQEGDGATEITVTATVGGSTRFGVDKAIVVTVTPRQSDTAMANYVDITPVSTFTITIPAGARSATGKFTLTPLDDNVAEQSINVDVAGAISGDSTTTISPGSLFVWDDDATPSRVTLSVSPSSITENGIPPNVTVTATVDGGTVFGTDKTVAVTVAGHNTAGQVKFMAPTRFNITIAAEAPESTHTFTLTPTDNDWHEMDGSAVLTGTLSGVTVIGASVTVTNDDLEPTGVTLSVSDDSVGEAEGPQTITVTATVKGSTRYGVARTVNVSVAGTGDADAVDYTATAPSAITIAAGAASNTTTFTLTPTNDTTDEFDETLTVSGSGTGIAAVTSAAITLTDDDDTTLAISAPAGAIAENGGTKDVTLTLSRALVSGESVTVPLDVVGVAAGSDYTLALQPSSQTGVALSTSGSDSVQAPAVTLSGGAETAVVRFTAVGDSTRTQPYALVRYGAGARAPSGTGIDFAAPTDGPVGWVITDDETGDIVVPQSWALSPSGVNNQGEPRFRLVFVSSAKRDASSTDIAEYDAFIRGLLAEGHAGVVPYAGFFTVLGSTAGVHLRDHADVTGSTTMPFYWLGETGDATKRVAVTNDQFRDEWITSETPSSQSVPRNESGTVVSVDGNGYFTGSTTAGARSANPLGSTNVTLGYLNDSGSGRAPLGSATTAANTATRSLYGLSPVFVRASAPVISVTTSQTSVVEGAALSFTVQAAPEPPNALTVRLWVSDDSGGDMVAAGEQTLAFAAGETSKTFTVSTADDNADEADAEVTVSVLNGNGYTVSSSADAAQVTVTDNDAMTVSVSGGGGTVDEGDSLDYTVDPGRSLASGETVTVNFAPAGTATRGTDYTITCHGAGVSCAGLGGNSPVMTISGGSGVRRGTIRVNALRDSTHPETGETAGISLRAGHSSTGSGGTFSVSGTPSTFTIRSDTASAVVVSLARTDSGNISEGGSGAAENAEFTVTLSRQLAQSEIVVVPLVLSGADAFYNEFTVAKLSSAANHGVSVSRGDTLAPRVRFDGHATDTVQTATLTLTAYADLKAESAETVTVALGPDDTSENGFDNTGLATNVGDVDPHGASNTFDVNIAASTGAGIDSNVIREGEMKTFTVSGLPAGWTEAPILSVDQPASSAKLAEICGHPDIRDTVYVGWDVCRSSPSVDSWDSNSREATFRLGARADNVSDPDEILIAGVRVADGDAVLFPITVREPSASLPFVQFDSVETTHAEDTAMLTIPVSVTPVSSSPIAVGYTLAGTATRGVDYDISGVTSDTGTLTIPANAGSASLTISFTDDSLLEGRETIEILLNSGTGYATGFMRDHEVTVTDSEKGLVFSKASLTLAEPGTGDPSSGDYLVALSQAPTGLVRVTVGESAGSDLTVVLHSTDTRAPDGELWFDPADYFYPQRVTVTAGLDVDGSADVDSITHSASGGGYGGITGTVSVTTLDTSSELIDVTMSASDGDADGNAVEGAGDSTGYRTITFTLSRAPVGTETVAVPLTVRGATVDVDYTLALSPSTQAGVELSTVGPQRSAQDPILYLSAPSSSATLRLTPIDDSDRTQPYVVIDYGTGRDVPHGQGGATLGTAGGGPIGVTLVDDETGDVGVPANWGLVPSGLSVGDDFRLLFRTSTGRDATSGDIADYDAFIRGVLATGGHADILPYAGFFKVFASTRSSGGSTGATARVHNDMTSQHTGHNPTWVDGSGTDSDAAGTPTYWLNGDILANNYRDLCDLAWSGSGTGVRDGFDRNDPRSEDGAQNVPSGTITAQNHEPWTGSGNACEAWSYPLGNSQVSRGGYGGGGSLWHTAQAPNTQARPLYGLSPVFKVTAQTATVTLGAPQEPPPWHPPDEVFKPVYEVPEGESVDVDVVLSNVLSTDITITIELDQSNGAQADVDYTAGPWSVTIPAGATSATFSVSTIEDNLLEHQESIVIAIDGDSLPSGVTAAAQATVRVAILDDEYILAAGGSSVVADERIGDVPIAWALNKVLTHDLDIYFLFTGLLSTAGSDFTPVHDSSSTALTIPAGEKRLLLRVPIISDGATSESNELVRITVQGVNVPATHNVQSADITILEPDATDNDEAVELTISGATAPLAALLPPGSGNSVPEGGRVTVTATVPTAPTGTSVTVPIKLLTNYLGADPNATDEDVVLGGSPVGVIVIPDGQTSASITLTALADGGAAEGGGLMEWLFLEVDTEGLSSGYRPGRTADILIEDTAAVPVTLSVSDSGAVTEGDGALTITATLGAANDTGSAVVIPIEVRALGTTAQAGDYTLGANSITIANGATTGTTTFGVINDSTPEDDETVFIRLGASLPSGFGAGDPPIIEIVISDDGDVMGTPVADFAVASSSAGEGSGTQNVAVSLAPAPVAAVTVNYALSGTATRGSDYDISGVTSANGSVQVGTSGSAVIPVAITDDTAAEGSETVTLTLSAGTGYDVGKTRPAHVLTITDDDTAGVTVSESARTVAEAAGTATYTVVLNSEPTHNVTITVTSTAPGAATVNKQNGAAGATQTLTFTSADWAGAQTITVTGVDDDIDNAGDRRTLNITHASTSTDPTYNNRTIAAVAVTVTDDDEAGVTVTPNARTVAEAGGTATYTVVLDSQPLSSVTITVNAGGAAFVDGPDGPTAPTATETLTFTTGDWDSPQTVTITGQDDNIDNHGDQRTRTISHTIASGDGDGSRYTPTTPTIPSVTVTVTDDDVAPSPVVTVRGGSPVNEGTAASFVISANPPPSSAISVAYTVTQNGQYVASGQLGSGKTQSLSGATATVTVPTVNDNADEADGSVTVTLNDGSGYTVGSPASATVTVRDDDVPSAQFAAAAAAAAEGEGTHNVRVNLSPAPHQDITVGYTVGGDATAGSDFTIANSGSLAVTAGTAFAIIPVTIIDDSAVESAETVTLTLNNGAGYGVGSRGVFTLTITDDDAPSTTRVWFASRSALTLGYPESQGNLYPTVYMDPLPPRDITINFAVDTNASTATLNQDYRLLEPLRDPDGDGMYEGTFVGRALNNPRKWAKFSMRIVDDNIREHDETIVFHLLEGAGYTLGDTRTRTLVLEDNERGPLPPPPPPPTTPVVTVAGGAAVNEGGNATFTITSNPAPTGNLTVLYTVTQDGQFVTSGQLGADKTETLDSSRAVISVATQNDSADEADGSVTVTLNSGQGYTVGAARSATVTVRDDDVPSAQFGSAADSAAENVGTHNVRVNLSPVSHRDVTIGYSASGSATRGSDYTVSGSVTARAGETFVHIPVNVVDDNTVENSETILLRLNTGTGYALGSLRSHTLTITDNDGAGLPVVTVRGGSPVDEGTAASFVISANPPPGSAISVAYTVTQNGRFVASGDLGGPKTRSLSGVTATVTVPTVNDSADEADGSVTVTLNNGSGYRLDAPVSATVTVRDDDVPSAQFAAAAAAAAENAGTHNVRVDLSPAPHRDITIGYTVGGDAAPGSDFTITGSGSVRVSAGAAFVDISVVLLDDSVAETDETVVLTLSDGTGYDVGSRGVFTLTVTDDDVAPGTPTAAFAADAESAAEGVGTHSVTLQVLPAPTAAITVRYTVGGDADPTSDYTAPSGTVNVAANTSAVTIHIPVTDDTANEGDETVVLTLSTPGDNAGYTLGDPKTYTLTILDDDVTASTPIASFRSTAHSMPEHAPARYPTAFLDPWPTSDVTIHFAVDANASTATLNEDYRLLESVRDPDGDGVYHGTFVALHENVRRWAKMTVILIDDRTREPGETIVIHLLNGPGYALGQVRTLTMTITDDD